MKTSNKLILIAGIVSVIIMLFTTYKVKSTIMSQVVQGNGNMIERSYSLEKINSLRLVGVEVELVSSDREELVLSVDENLAYIAQVNVHGEELEVSLKKDSLYNPTNGVKLKIYCRNLDSIQLIFSKLSGTIIDSNLVLEMQGSSDADLIFEGSRIDVSGVNSCDVTIGGKCDTLNVSLTNSSDINSRKLKAKVCNIKAVNSSDATIYGDVELNATLVNSSDLTYYGEAKLNKIVTQNSSSIEKGE